MMLVLNRITESTSVCFWWFFCFFFVCLLVFFFFYLFILNSTKTLTKQPNLLAIQHYN